MGDDIRSYGQSGGVTAGQVNMGEGQFTVAPTAPAPNPTGPFWKSGKFIAGSITIAAAIVAILTYFGIQPKGGKMPEGSFFHVSSYNQQGGITAGQVNIGRPPRKLDDGSKAQLLKQLPRDQTITVTSLLGDGEGGLFAEEIKAFLVAQGFTVKGVDQAVMSGPVIGQHILKKDGGVEILVGTREQ